MGIQTKLNENYCKEIESLIDKIKASKSTLDKKALNAIENAKKSIKTNHDILVKQLKAKKVQNQQIKQKQNKLKKQQNYIDIQTKLNENYCKEIESLIDKI